MATSRDLHGFLNLKGYNSGVPAQVVPVTGRSANRTPSSASANESDQSDTRVTPRTVRLAQLAVVAVVAASIGLTYLLSDAFRSELGRAVMILGQGDASALQEYIVSFGNWAPAISLFLMVLQAPIVLVPSSVVTFANGLAFGVFWGWLLSVAGHVLAAAVCFWIARAVGRGSVETLTGRTGFAAVDGWFARRGAHAIFLARLVPGVPFNVVSYAAGVLQIGFGKFLVVTALGTLPESFLYAYMGRNAPQYVWLLLVTSVVVTSVIIAVKFLANRRASRRGDSINERGVCA